MAEGLQTPDGKSLDLEAADRKFSEAMAAPETDVPAPRKMTAEQKEAIKAEPKRTRTRTAKTDKARTTATTSEKVDKDFTEDISNLTDGAWLVGASIPYTQPYAAVIKVNQPALIASLNSGAQNNSTLRGYIEKASSGAGGMWMVSLGVVSVNMGMQILQIAKDPELRNQLAEQTKVELTDYMKVNGLIPEETTDARIVSS
jgi:hypothetical protein